MLARYFGYLATCVCSMLLIENTSSPLSSMNWLSSLLNAKKSCLKQNHLLKVHYALPDGREMVEEYDTNIDVLTRRAWKVKNAIGDGDEWSIEVGDPERIVLMNDGSLIQENSSQVRVCFLLRCV